MLLPLISFSGLTVISNPFLNALPIQSQVEMAVAAGVPTGLTDELAKYKNADKISKARLKKFDNLDFDVFTNQKWDRLKESHAKDIVVVWPDGHETKGIEKHIEDLKAMFVYAPDTRIHEHPVRITNGEYTSVIGVMEGTFTKPMPIGNGQFIQPTGKAYKINMVTVGHWKGATMDKEYLFWDNATFMKQLGLSK